MQSTFIELVNHLDQYDAMKSEIAEQLFKNSIYHNIVSESDMIIIAGKHQNANAFSYIKRYVTGSPAVYTLTVSNTSINTLAIYDDGVLTGTVGMRGNKRSKTFSIKSGDVITIRDDNNALVEPAFTIVGNITKNY